MHGSETVHVSDSKLDTWYNNSLTGLGTHFYKNTLQSKFIGTNFLFLFHWSKNIYILDIIYIVHKIWDNYVAKSSLIILFWILYVSEKMKVFRLRLKIFIFSAWRKWGGSEL